MLLGGVYKLREIVADCSLVGIFIAPRGGQFAVVDALHGAVMGGEGDVTLLGSGIELGDIAFVYLGQYGSVYHTGAYAVEHVGEPAVVLTVYAGELYGGVEALVQGEAVEEVGAFIEARQYLAFVVLDYRRVVACRLSRATAPRRTARSCGGNGTIRRLWRRAGRCVPCLSRL